MSIKFAVIGINHAHIFGQVKCLLEAGAQLVTFYALEDDLAAQFSSHHSSVPRATSMHDILEDPSIQVIVTAAIPRERAGIAIIAMQHGKDILSDKPGMTSLDQLNAIQRVQAETGRIYSIHYSEHFDVRATVEAGNLVAAGAIGTVVNIVGLGPHTLRLDSRPDWFFDREQYGGILCDIASHQFEQFLFFSDALDAQVVSASVANRAHPQYSGLQDVGDVHIRTNNTTGYIRVDWFSPDLPVFGDGRLTILGTKGYIELRKYIDIAGREGGDHLFIVNNDGQRHVDCSNTELPFGRQFLHDVRHRTESAMPQQRCFNAMKLALVAQAKAEEGTAWARRA